VDYDAPSRQVRLIDPVVESFEIDGAPGNYAGAASFAAGVMAGESMKAFPIYKVEPDAERKTFGALRIKDVRVENGKLMLSLSFDG